MDDLIMGIGLLGVLLYGLLLIRSSWIKTKRSVRNSFIALRDDEPLEQVEMEEAAKRMANRMMENPEKKKRGGFLKILLLIGVAIAVLYFISQA